jgi:D-tyrosyl-tRNA(Tyr) deacylase
MRAVVQRVSEAKVEVEGVTVGSIGKGLLVLLGVEHSDTEADVSYLARKVASLRIFNDADGKMNISVSGAGGSILVVSQFTLYGDARRGSRPSFDRAAKSESAKHLYENFVNVLRNFGLHVQTGVFQAHMSVQLINDGPVTLLCESVKISPAE